MYEGLTRPQLMAGCERSAFFALVTACFVIVYFGGIVAGKLSAVAAAFFIFGVGRWLLSKAAAKDPQLREVSTRAFRHPKRLDAVSSQAAGARGKRATSDLLGFAEMVAPGVLRMKDGGFVTGFSIRGADLESAGERAWDTAAEACNGALRVLSSGWSVHVESARRPVKRRLSRAFVEPVSVLIEQERQRMQFMDTAQWVFVTYTPPAMERGGFLARARDWALERPRSGSAGDALRADLVAFERTVEAFERALSTGMSVRRFRSGQTNDELLQALRYCLRGEWAPTRLPSVPVCIDTLLAEGLQQGDPMTLGRQLVRAISLRGYPGESFAGILSVLEQLPMEYRFSQRYIVQDYRRSDATLEMRQRNWEQSERSIFAQMVGLQGRVRLHARQRAEELDVAKMELDAGEVIYGQHTAVVLVRGATVEEVTERTRMVERALEGTGFVCQVETHNGLEALIGSLPGHTKPNVRRPVIHSLNAANLAPLSREWPGHASCPSPYFRKGSEALATVRARSGARFCLNIHAGDIGHTLVVGPTGAGKSVMLAFLAERFTRYQDQGARVYCFDVGRSMMTLAKARTDAVHVDFELDPPQLCPLGVLDSEEEIAWATGWIEALLGFQRVAVKPAQKRLILEALRTFSRARGSRSLSNFLSTLQDEELREALQYYTRGGPAGGILDGDRTEVETAPFVVFEMASVQAKGEAVLAATVLCLNRMLERQQDGSPRLYLMDEVWRTLASDGAASRLNEMLLESRKKNCAVVLAAQTLSQVFASSVRDVVLESCKTRILLPNPDATAGGIRELYAEHLQLTGSQIEAIASATPKREYFLSGPDGVRMFELAVGPVALSFLGVDTKPAFERVRELEDEYGPSWPVQWLRERELEAAAERLEREQRYVLQGLGKKHEATTTEYDEQETHREASGPRGGVPTVIHAA